MTLIARIQSKPIEPKTTLRAGSPDDNTAKAEPSFREELRRGARGTPAPEAEIDDDPDGTKTTQVFARPNRQQQDAATAAKELLAFVFGTSQNAPQVPIIEEPQVEVIAATAAVAAVQNNLEMALTPLEQAVHDLIGQLVSDKTDDDDEPHDTDEIPIADISAMTMTPDVAPAPVRPTAIDHRAHVASVAPMTAPEDAPEVTNTNLSHVNLVLEDGGERVVVTVAVRGTEVNVALRGSDDNTTAALARNAGTLDHAMRARGLDLNDFSAEPDRDQREQERPKHEQPRRQNGPAFTFEEPK